MIVPRHVPEQFAEPSDAAKRCSDAVNLAAIAGSAGMWIAVRLADGGTDGGVYDSRETAIRHQLRPQFCTYVRVPPDGMKPWDGEALLDYWRKLSDAGVRDDDPDVPMPMIPLTRADRRRQIRVLAKGRRLCRIPRPPVLPAPAAKQGRRPRQCARSGPARSAHWYRTATSRQQ